MRKPVRTAAWRGAIAALGAAMLFIVGASVSTGAAEAATGPYVALGDSYTAAPLVPKLTGRPILCGRSTANYPQDVARAISPRSFIDASCSGATTVDMTQPQSLEGGLQTAPPQFDALTRRDALVTLGIGGNDAGVIGIALECARLDIPFPFGARCRNHYAAGGSDPNVAAIAATGPKVVTAIQGIHARAPHARVLVVGYPDDLSQTGVTCYPIVPLSSTDVRYLNSLELQLNAVIEQTARANHAAYVDTFSSSVGHDACQGPNAWVNGLIPTSRAFPLHPNATGEANMAVQVEGEL